MMSKLLRLYTCIFALCLLLSPSAEAADVSATKQWTITFSKPLQHSSLSAQTMYIQTPSGHIHPTHITSLNDTTVQLKPLSPYIESGTYTIVITHVEDITGTHVTPYTHTFSFTPVPKATWIWNAYALHEEDAQFLIDQHVTKVYVQVESELPDAAYVPFFETLRANDIDIYALEGFAGLQFQDVEKTARFVKWVTQFQQQYQYFTGIHLDIEPYTDPSWQWNEQSLLAQYFTHVQQLQATSRALNLRFEIDMPFWFDEVTYTNHFGTGNAANWLIDHSDEVTIMAYRNDASAIVPLVADEFMYAQQQRKQMTIALETAQSFEGDFISFYDVSALTLYEAMDTLHHTYDATIAIHYLPTWQALLQQHKPK